MFYVLAACFASAVLSVGDTVLPPATVLSFRDAIPAVKAASPLSSIMVAESGVRDQAGLSSRIPGLHIPQYGASLTSTIYMRGFGSRMDNPVLGLYLDGIPVLDKNAYDIDYMDIRKAVMLRGPQGTLYGRNSLGGVLSLQTASPGSEPLSGISLEYGTARSAIARLSVSRGDHRLSASFRHTDGYFPNLYTSRMCDPFNGGQLRWRWVPSPGAEIQFDHVLQAAFSREGGFAYGRFDGSSISPVNYNGEGSYSRLAVLDGSRVGYRGDKIRMDASASVQLLFDDMKMDQDYSPEDIFDLRQRQRSGAFTAEALFRPAEESGSWHPVTGVFIFGQYKDIHAPVHFKRDGIQSLILDNANAHIPPEIGYLAIPDSEFPVLSDFGILTLGAAVFHESVFRLGNWTLTAGLRVDGEFASMRYDCSSSLHYRFVPTMAAARPFALTYEGDEGHSHLVLLPRLSAGYDISEALMLYATVSRGLRAGGFNTQIFSDILQVRMMDGMMKELGVYLDSSSSSIGADATEYRPEKAWNMESGLRFRGEKLSIEASVYRMEGYDQQLTFFPPGKSTGRMMANAARSRSTGAETELHYDNGRFRSSLAYAFCDARFVRYESSGQDYSGNRVPYIPAHTVFASISVHEPLRGSCAVEAELHPQGAGGLFWNEENTRREGFHFAPGTRLSITVPRAEFYLSGERLAVKQYPVFYFKSVGREFFALSRPAAIAFGINLNL
ncbi:MAG: TonB-dependent receptor [Bacteroidales bacterium]|nr:TonB-dependent receptor [Bacteroidales bacterium]